MIPHRALTRLKRTRAAQVFKRRVLRRRAPAPVRASVVVPIYNAAPHLTACLESLANQTHPELEVILVDDGSTDGSLDIARSYAETHPGFLLVTQSHMGIGVARNHGVQRASGRYLAFCDADDVVRRGGYERLTDRLENTGSDIAVGSVDVQRYGKFEEPTWARRSNPIRRDGVRLEDAPHIMANQILGTRMFRRAFWDQHGFAFPAHTDHPDAVLLVRSLLKASSIDIVPAVCYQWRWREDLQSSAQRDLRDARRVGERLDSLCSAGELVVTHSNPEVQRQYFAEILHTTAPELVRAAVTRPDAYWQALSRGLRRLMDMMSAETVREVPVEDRITVWLCARDERMITEDFLEYARDHKSGYPHRHIEGRPYIHLPFTDALLAADDDLIRVADRDMRYRTSLRAMRWDDPGVLHLEGAAFIEYVGDDAGESEIDLLLREETTGRETTIGTVHPTGVAVNQWSGRAYEDHEGGAFAADIDIEHLRALDRGTDPLTFEVLVRLRVAGLERIGYLQTRRVNGSAGLLEVSRRGGLEAEPRWRDFRGLAIAVGSAEKSDEHESGPEASFVVDEVAPRPHAIEVIGAATEPVELALHGPRVHTPWVRADASASGWSARIPVYIDEWGLGPTALPIDNYKVMARYADGSIERVSAGDRLRRQMPMTIDAEALSFLPSATTGGSMSVRVEPAEIKLSRPMYYRRRLRENVYVPSREKPLLPTVLFETFAGKAAGDSPGALCEELARRSPDLDLVFSVSDLSVVIPDGARAVLRWSREWHELIGRARYIVINANLPYFFKKRPDQTFVETWHGTPLKNIGHDRPTADFDNWHHRRQLTAVTPTWDYLVSQCEFCTRALRSAFRYEGAVLESGYPRNDILSSPAAGEIRRRTRKLFGLREDQRVILYAPTWRDNLRSGQVFNRVIYMDTHAVVEQVENSAILVRGHYNTIGAPSSDEVDDRIIDVTRYPDISHLFLAADVLVTDYSSVFFDFATTDKPMIFLAPDLEQYRDDIRGFALDYHETVPGPVCFTTDEVIEALQGPDDHGEARKEFRAKFAPKDDGHASSRVIDAVFGA